MLPGSLSFGPGAFVIDDPRFPYYQCVLGETLVI